MEVRNMDDRAKKGASSGTAIAIIGLLMIIAVLVLKFVGPGELPLIGEYPVGEINPNGQLSIHFFTGIVIGIIILIIGGAMSRRKKEEPVEELEEGLQKELEELEEEIEEEGICPTCGAVIPIDADECPECGEELEPPEEFEEEFEEGEEEILVSKNCPICGAELPDEVDECPECGEPLGEEGEEDVFEDL